MQNAFNHTFDERIQTYKNFLTSILIASFPTAKNRKSNFMFFIWKKLLQSP